MGDLSGIYQHYPHHIVPAHNTYSSNNFDEYSFTTPKSCPLKSTYPKPMYTSKIPNTIDDVTKKIVRQKQEYCTELERLKKFARKNLSSLYFIIVYHYYLLVLIININIHNKENNEKKNGRRRPVQSKYFQEYVELLECDPDSYFNGLSNWYYTGGTVATAKTNDNQHWLCHASGTELNELGNFLQ